MSWRPEACDELHGLYRGPPGPTPMTGLLEAGVGRELSQEFSAGPYSIPPPPGLPGPSVSPSLDQQHASICALLTTTPPPSLGTAPAKLTSQEPQYLSVSRWGASPGPRCESPLQALGISVSEDSRSPEVRPLCPQPRRAFVPPLFEQPSLPSSPSPALGTHLGMSPVSELSELFGNGPDKKEWHHPNGDASSRPLSSVSTSAGPTPSPDDFLRSSLAQMQPSFRASSPGLGLDESRFGSDAGAAAAAAAAAAVAAAAAAYAEHLQQQSRATMPAGMPPFLQQQHQLQPAPGPPSGSPPCSVPEVSGGAASTPAARKRSGRRSMGTEGPSSQSVAAASANVQPSDAGLRGQEGQQLTKSAVVQMSKTQAGSKLLQRKLLKGHPSVIKDILEGLETELPEIMCNMYGNYLCSAAFQSCSVYQRLRMLEITSQHLRTIAKDKWGTHALQSLLSLVCTVEEQGLLLPSLQEHAVELSCDQHGTHVVQRALISFGTPCPDLLLQELLRTLCVVAHNPHGLCVLKRCILQTKSGPNQQRLIHEMAKHALDLVQSPYGNYVIQHSFEEWGADVCWPIVQALGGKLLQLSIQKFSSNVVEHMLKIMPPEARLHLVEELANREQTHVLMTTVYGMHVARQLLKVVSLEQRLVLDGIYNATLRGSRNQRLRERWEGLLTGDGLPTSSVSAKLANEEESPPGLGQMPADAGVSAPRRRRGGRGVGSSSAACSQRPGAPDTAGALTPGLLMNDA
eukprot:TRINITY_DN105661_c0_g1_i1.p1 TRINITY_DN105661_c0_g1~~TRINITY_DN105661_c0_g1_i1.p1  ORF type:complete len:743 (+),score=150.29 TRINITY_DN105661_c0_g1_i1:121-2349(+)